MPVFNEYCYEYVMYPRAIRECCTLLKKTSEPHTLESVISNLTDINLQDLMKIAYLCLSLLSCHAGQFMIIPSAGAYTVWNGIRK